MPTVGQFCVVFGDFKISLLIETAKFENGVPVKLNSVNPIIVKFKRISPLQKPNFLMQPNILIVVLKHPTISTITNTLIKHN